MNQVSVDIARLLESRGYGRIGASSGWCICSDIEPPLPDTCITVYDVGGPQHDHAMVESDSYGRKFPAFQRTDFQIRVRASNNRIAWLRMEKCESIDRYGPFDVEPDVDANSGDLGTHYCRIMQTSEPIYMQRDQLQRLVWVVNFRAYRQEKL